MKLSKDSLLLYIYTILFILLIVFRLLFEGSREGGGGVWNVFQIIFVLTGVSIYIQYHSKFNNKSQGKIFVVFSFYILFLTIPYFLDEFTILSLFNFITVPFGAMVFVTFYYVGLKNDFKKIKSILLFTFYIISIIFIFKRQNYLVGAADFDTMVINSYYSLCLLPLILIFHNKKFSFLPFIVVLFLIFLSGKRVGIITLAFLLPIYYLNFSSKIVTIIKNILSLILIILAINYIYIYLNDMYGLDITYRLKNLTEDGGSGRDIIWKTINKNIWDSNIFYILFGHGYNSVYALVGNNAHNDFIQVFYEYGFIALVMYIYFYFSLFKTWFKMQKNKYPYSRNFLLSIIVALFLANFSFFIIEARIIICSSLCWGFFLADWKKFQNNGYVAL
ncbi:MAG: O-antigen ligase family protein [Bacteroidales bacterium]|jgi:hypothetical protein